VRFLVDECTGPAVARWLERAGHDVLSVYDQSPGADDSAALDRVLQAHSDQLASKFVVVTEQSIRISGS